MEKELISDLKNSWDSAKYKKAHSLLVDKIAILNKLETDLNEIKDTKDININLLYYKEEFKKNLSFEEKVELSNKFISEFN